MPKPQNPAIMTSIIKHNYKSAFTLAEVLVTLAIIGVVASLTIPSLVKSYQDTANYTKWKKQYSIAKQAIKMIQANNGFANVSDPSIIRDDFESVLGAFVKKGNWNTMNTQYYNYYKNTTGQSSSTWISRTGLRSDGSMWGFWTNAWVDCNGVSTNGVLTGICSEIRIDVNGTAPPNMFGKDLFWLWLVRNNGVYDVYPYGSRGDGKVCEAGAIVPDGCNGCSALALIRSPADMP